MTSDDREKVARIVRAALGQYMLRNRPLSEPATTGPTELWALPPIKTHPMPINEWFKGCAHFIVSTIECEGYEVFKPRKVKLPL